MGLMYIFPVSDELKEDDRVEIKDEALILKTYGLPMIFWGYLAATLSLLFIMWLASHAVIAKILTYQEDTTLLFIGHLVRWTLFLTPATLLAFFFYEKIIIKKNCELTVLHRLFFLPVFKKTYQLKTKDALVVEHFLSSPNMIKLRNKQGLPNYEAMKGFENKGYFELSLRAQNGTRVSIDRHARKNDLLKMRDLLSKY